MTRASLLLSLLLFFGNLLLLQAQDFAAIDQHAMNFKPSGDLATTTQQLVAPYSTELEKARAIFTYVATSMSYDCKEYHREPEDRKARTRPEILERAFEKNLGVCAGYAILFDEMCEAAGLNAEVVSGTPRTGAQRYHPERLPESHAWNAIEIDGKWHLLDATWASGYTDPEATKFTSSFDDRFFMEAPESFFLRHFPADDRWQLLPEVRTADDFVKQPSVFRIPQTLQLSDFSPTEGFLPTGEAAYEFRIRFTGADIMFLTMGSRRYEMALDAEGYYHYRLERSELRGRSIMIRAVEGDRIWPVVEYRIGG
jgi:hypothetical protein